MTMGRKRNIGVAGQIVRDEIYRNDEDIKSFAEAHPISRSTLTRLARGESVSDMNLRLVEKILDLPRHFLTYVIDGDTGAIKTSGADPDLVRWTMRQLGAEPPPPVERTE